MTAIIESQLPGTDEPRPSKTWVKALLALLCAAMAAMWVYYFVFASDKGVYQMQDKSWRVAAERICQDATAQREALTDTDEGYIANPTNDQMVQRADVVDRATDILDRMVTDLVAIPVDNQDDRDRLAVFEEHYRIVIADRRRYTDSLRRFELRPYTETVAGGGPVSNVVLDFTAGVKGNDVPECSPPGELGGDVQV